jgi:DNA-binding MarR family transcriptional regulator
MSILANEIDVEEIPDGLAALSPGDRRALSRILARARAPRKRVGFSQQSFASMPVTGEKFNSSGLPLVVKAKAMLLERQRRTRFFARSMFGEPGWDILLALFINDQTEQMNITQIVLLIDTPTTTVLRWLKSLQADQLITVRKDWRDGRMSIVGLAEKGRSTISTYFEESAQAAAGVRV